jgi:hypothetical protein
VTLQVHQTGVQQERTIAFAKEIRSSVHRAMAKGHGTKDLCGPEGLSTEDFVKLVRIVKLVSNPSMLHCLPSCVLRVGG